MTPQELCADQGLSVIPYSPPAGGFLTGKYRWGAAVPSSARASGVQQRYFNERAWAILDALDTDAGSHNAQPAQVALVWLLARPGITAPIIGANTPDQLATSLGALDVRLAEEQIKQLDQASVWQE